MLVALRFTLERFLTGIMKLETRQELNVLQILKRKLIQISLIISLVQLLSIIYDTCKSHQSEFQPQQELTIDNQDLSIKNR